MQSQVPLRKLERDIHTAPGYSPSNFCAAVCHWDNIVHSLLVRVLTVGPKIAKAVLYLADCYDRFCLPVGTEQRDGSEVGGILTTAH